MYVSLQWWWRLLIVVAGSAGLYGAGYSVVAYTTQSAIIVVGYYAAALYWMHHRRTTDAPAPRLRAAVMSWVLLSGLVLHFVLAGGTDPLPGLAGADPSTLLANRSSFLLHYALPGLVLLDWLLFRPYGAARWRDLVLWMLYPLGYVAAVLARGALGLPYPYAFLDPTIQGWTGVGTWTVTLAAGFLLLSAVCIAFDRLREPPWPPDAVPPRPDSYRGAPAASSPASWPGAAPATAPPACWPGAAPATASPASRPGAAGAPIAEPYAPASRPESFSPYNDTPPPGARPEPTTTPSPGSRPPLTRPRTAMVSSWPDAADPYTAAEPSWPPGGPYSAAPQPAETPRSADGPHAAQAPRSTDGPHAAEAPRLTAGPHVGEPAWPGPSPYNTPPRPRSPRPPVADPQTTDPAPAWPDAARPYSQNAGPHVREGVWPAPPRRS